MSDTERMTRFQLLVEQKYDSLTSQEKKLSHYLLENQDFILDYSVKDLSSAADVSLATVVRFCKSMGFNGLKEFKIAITSGTLNMKDAFDPITWENPTETIFRKFFSQSVKVMEKSYAATSPQDITRITEKLAEISAIDVIGIGGSATIVEHFKHEFLRLGKRISSFTSPYAIRQMLNSMFPSQAVIAISASGETSEIVEAIKKARSNSSFVVVITSNPNSTAAKLSDATITTPAQKVFYNDEHSLSRIAQMAMISTIYIAVAQKMAEKNNDFKVNYIETTRYQKSN